MKAFLKKKTAHYHVLYVAFFFSVTSPQYIGTALLGIQCDYTYSMYMRATLHADARWRHVTASRHDQNINTGTHTDAGGPWVYATSSLWDVDSFWHRRQSTRITDIRAQIMHSSSSSHLTLREILSLWPYLQIPVASSGFFLFWIPVLLHIAPSEFGFVWVRSHAQLIYGSSRSLGLDC